MAGFTIPSLSDTRDLLVAAFRALFPDRNVSSKRSYHSRRLTTLAAAVTQIHDQVNTVQNDVMPDTAGDDGAIDRWGKIVGITRKPATSAHNTGAGTVRGAGSTIVPAGQTLVHPASGLVFQIASQVTTPAGPAPQSVAVDLIAVDTGSQTRLVAGTVLVFQATPLGLESNVVLVKDLNQDGFDSEGFGAYRSRVLGTFSEARSGGSQSDFVDWTLELAGFSQGFAYPDRAGIGTVDVVGLHSGTGTNRIPSAPERATLLAYLKTKAPAHLAGTPGALRVLTPVADTQNVEIQIQTNGLTGTAFDWADAAGYTVLAWTAGTRTLQFTGGALPPTLKAGHRIILKGVASVQDGRQYVVEAISGVDTVILQTAPINPPASTDPIYSGGPLVDAIRNAIIGHMNGETVYAGKNGIPATASSLTSTVGLEVLATGIGTANPAGVYGAWSGGLIRAVLGKLAMYQTGVRNYTILTPAADYEAVDYAVPLDTQIGLIVPGSVIVRSA